MSAGLRPAVVLLVCVVVISAIWMMRLRRSVPVDAITPQRQTVTEVIVATGRLQAVRTSQLGTDVPGVVSNDPPDAGHRVRAGEPLVVLSDETAMQRVLMAEAQLQTAQRQLQQASARPLPDELARARAELLHADEVGTAQVQAARQRLAQAERGGRGEDRTRAEATLNQARATRELAETELKRAEALFQRDAISRADLDRAEARVKEALALERAAEASRDLIARSADDYDIEVARAQLRQAEAQRRGTVEVAKRALAVLLQSPRREAVEAARSRVEEAKQALEAARTELSKYTVRAPYDAVVVERLTQRGASVQPGMPLMRLADMSDTEIIVETDENNLNRLQLGQTAQVVSPSFRDRPWTARLTRIGPGVDSQRGVTSLQLKSDRLPSFVLPDMTVDVSLEVKRLENALTVPSTAVVETNNEASVFVIRDGRAVRRSVRVLGRSTDTVAVSGLSERDLVIRSATEVSEGQRVTARALERTR